MRSQQHQDSQDHQHSHTHPLMSLHGRFNQKDVMDSFDERDPVLLHEVSSVERAEISLLLLNNMLEGVDQEQSVICCEAYAAAEAFFGEESTILESVPGAMLLAEITERGNRLTITWYWDYSNWQDGKRSPSRPTFFPPLPPSVFRYPKSRFQKLDEPIRSRVMGVEAKFSSLRKRYAKLSDIRRMLVSYKGSIERLLSKELALDTQVHS